MVSPDHLGNQVHVVFQEARELQDQKETKDLKDELVIQDLMEHLVTKEKLEDLEMLDQLEKEVDKVIEENQESKVQEAQEVCQDLQVLLDHKEDKENVDNQEHQEEEEMMDFQDVPENVAFLENKGTQVLQVDQDLEDEKVPPDAQDKKDLKVTQVCPEKVVHLAQLDDLVYQENKAVVELLEIREK